MAEGVFSRRLKCFLRICYCIGENVQVEIDDAEVSRQRAINI
jgi:hypothetical protein